MLKIHNGKLYDTDTAEHVLTLSSLDCGNEPCIFSRGLFRTAKGSFFTACLTEPDSIWSSDVASGRIPGTEIAILSEDEACNLLFCEGRADLISKYLKLEAA